MIFFLNKKKNNQGKAIGAYFNPVPVLFYSIKKPRFPFSSSFLLLLFFSLFVRIAQRQRTLTRQVHLGRTGVMFHIEHVFIYL